MMVNNIRRVLHAESSFVLLSMGRIKDVNQSKNA